MSNILYDMDLLTDSGTSTMDLDYFILASGCDKRAYKVLKDLKVGVSTRTEVILLNFKERIKSKRANNIIYDYKKLGIKNLREFSCEIKNPNSCLADFETVGFDSVKKLGLDLSCLTKPYFFFLLKLLKERFNFQVASIFYTEPQSYLFQKGLFNTFHTNTGPLTVEELQGFPGERDNRSKRKLIYLLGFDRDLSKEINVDVSPNETVVINGFPSYSSKFKDISLVTNERLVSDHNIKVRYAKANNPFEVYNLLEAIKNEDRDETFMNIAPLGTKPMALGACLFALHNPDVRIVYPMPEKYDDKYSDDCWNSWKYSLPLSI